jgi:diguanylate cyclase (GGDEF)-like protein
MSALLTTENGSATLLKRSIQADQLIAVRRSVMNAMPVNMLLGLACAVISFYHGSFRRAILWYSVSMCVNILRMVLCRWRLPEAIQLGAGKGTTADALVVQRHLRLGAVAALVSGVVWGFVPVLCEGYTSPQTLFYLTVVCGITAGAVTHGMAYSRIPISFVTPVLLSVAGCLLYAGGFDRNVLAATVVLYLSALVRSSIQSEGVFRESSSRKHAATTLAISLREAHGDTLNVAEQMRYQALHDALTGLLNRAGFLQAAEKRIVEASAAGKHTWLLLVDLDGFKAVNDLFGHKAGDQVLAQVALQLESVFDKRALIGRLGGDEFAILYEPADPARGQADDPADPARGQADDPAELALRLLRVIPLSIYNAGRLGASIGIHCGLPLNLSERLTCADEALYAAKRIGRNQFRVFDGALQARLAVRRDIERDLPQAIQAGALEIWFQPIFHGGGQKLDSLEALLRWNHPVHQWIPPPDVIFTAAVTGQSEILVNYILNRICDTIDAMRVVGIGPVPVAMNVSPREMAQIAVDEIVLETLARRGIPASLLEIEITEETTMDIEIVQDRLTKLAQGGVRIAVDDFGIGFSSLGSLRHRHVSRVKIDKSFVTGLEQSADDRVLVQSILNLGRSLNVDVVAEGVETEADLRTLQSLGCDIMQGYHLARPMPAAHLFERADTGGGDGTGTITAGSASTTR